MSDESKPQKGDSPLRTAWLEQREALSDKYQAALEQIIKLHATHDGDVAKMMCEEAACALSGEAACDHD